MIRIDSFDPDSKIVWGFRLDVDGFTGTDYYELDQQAAQSAINRYLDHRERLYTDAPPELDGTTSWLIHGLARIPWLWEDFQVYYLFAKLRIVLADEPQAVNCVVSVDRPVDSALAQLCEEFDVEYSSPVKSTSTLEAGGTLDSWIASLIGGFSTRLSAALARLQLWLMFYLFAGVRPFVVKIYKITRSQADTRILLNAFKDHSHRFFDAPAELENRNRRVGYAVYDEPAMSGLKPFIRRGLRTVRRTVDPEEPVHVEWYATLSAFRTTIEKTSEFRSTLASVAGRAGTNADSPEFSYLAGQLQTLSTNMAFQVLFKKAAFEGFADNFADQTWVHARPPTKDIPRLMAMVGERKGITTVAVAPHYYSETRVSSRFTGIEVNDEEAVTLPDLNVVFEPLSARRFKNEGLPSTTIAIARDKAANEARVIADGPKIPGRREISSVGSPSGSDGGPARVLVLLDEPLDNRNLIQALERGVANRTDVELVFKPHPFYPPGDDLFEGFRADRFDVTAPDADLAELVETCDICLSIYSTAAFPALARAIPVVWVPFVSPNHILMDLTSEVGLRADDSEELVNQLDRLVREDSFYEEQARACARFADRELVPDADAPSLADLLEQTI